MKLKDKTAFKKINCKKCTYYPDKCKTYKKRKEYTCSEYNPR
jgi:hypothetical protein